MVNYDASNDNYEALEKHVSQALNNAVANGDKVFTTNAEGLFNVFLANIPHYARQYYTCRACESFFNKYAGLVTIDGYGDMKPVFWKSVATPSFFKQAVYAMYDKILDSKVTGVFLTDEKYLGRHKDGSWTHFYAEVPDSLRNKITTKKAHEVVAEYNTSFLTLTSALQKYTLSTTTQALQLLGSESLYRGDKILPQAQWFTALQESLVSVATSNKTKNNLKWLAVAKAPLSFTRIPSSTYGSLLEDLEENLPINLVASRFKAKMNPDTHQRSQTDATDNQIYEASKVIKDLGLENSLGRRYAKLEDITQFEWLAQGAHKEVTEVEKEISRGVFDHLQSSKKSTPKTPSVELPTAVMTWSKFQRTILPFAESIEAKVDNPSRIMAMVTALDPDAPSITQWENNPLTWYYAGGGIDGAIKERVESAGGKYEDNVIRCSLMWEGYTDLDLHCITPQNKHIYYARDQRRDSYGGYLDLDMNGLDRSSNTPVENMRWSKVAPEGRYKFFVHNYTQNGHGKTPFVAELDVEGYVFRVEGEPLSNKEEVVVFEFDYKRGQVPVMLHGNAVAQTVATGGFKKVNGITLSPNLWGDNPVTHAGTHIFFLLDEFKDTKLDTGRGFVTEMLKSELRPIRKVLNMFADQTPIEGYEEASACGVGYSKDGEWNLVLKVKTKNSTQLVTIDRWD